MAYGELIRSAFQIALRHPRLWPFGVFAGTGGFGFNFNFSYEDDGSLDPSDELIVGLVLGALLLVVLGAVASVLAQGALVRGVTAAEEGQGRRFGQAFRDGRATFWRTAGLYVLAALIALALVAAVAVPAGGAVIATFAATGATGPRVAVVILAVLAALAGLLVLLLPLAVILQHAVRELVLGGARPVAALRGGWRVLRANPAPSLVLFLIQQGLVVVAYTALAVAAGLLCLPAIVVLVATDAGAAGIIVAAVTALLVIPAGLAAAGAVGTFGHGLWTLGYRRMVALPR